MSDIELVRNTIPIGDLQFAELLAPHPMTREQVAKIVEWLDFMKEALVTPIPDNWRNLLVEDYLRKRGELVE